jgi:hypothetical protein
MKILFGDVIVEVDKGTHFQTDIWEQEFTPN